MILLVLATPLLFAGLLTLLQVIESRTFGEPVPVRADTRPSPR